MTPENVYMLVDERTSRTFWALVALCVLVAIQVIAKVIIFGRVNGLLNRARVLLGRAEGAYKMAAEEGRITDRQNARLQDPINEIKQDVKVVREHVTGEPPSSANLRESGRS